MAESTIQTTFQELYQDVLNYQGLDRDSSDATELATAKRRVNDGYKKFLVFDWSWKSESDALEVQGGKYEYELPDDYAYLKTPFKLAPNTGYIAPRETSYANLLQYRSFYPMQGTPFFYAFRTTYDKEVGIRYILVLYPTPNSNFTYNYEYSRIVNELVNNGDIPYCPANLSPVLRAFCLAEVEKFDDEGSKDHWTTELYKTLLPQALRDDSKRTPGSVGNMNNVSGIGDFTMYPQWGNQVTINNDTYYL